MTNTYIIKTQTGEIETESPREAIKTALRNRVDTVIINFENEVKFGHAIGEGSILILTKRLTDDVTYFKDEFLQMIINMKEGN